MSKSTAPFASSKHFARHLFDDSVLSSEAHSEDEYDTPLKDQEKVPVKRQRDKSDEGGKSPLIKKFRANKVVKSRSICKSSPGEKSKTQSKMFKNFQKEESSDEEPQNFSFGNTPKKSSDKKSFNQSPKRSVKNPIMDKWVVKKKTALKEVNDNSNCDSENIDANKRQSTSKVSSKGIKNETEKVHKTSSKKKSSAFSDASDYVENETEKAQKSAPKKMFSAFSDVSDLVENHLADCDDVLDDVEDLLGPDSEEDIKAVDEMSLNLEPLDNSIPTDTLQKYKIPKLPKGEISKNKGEVSFKGELNFDRQLKNSNGDKEKKAFDDSSHTEPVKIIPILKKHSSDSSSSVEPMWKTRERLDKERGASVLDTGDNKAFKFPDHLKQSSKSNKASEKKAKTGSEVFDEELDEGGSKPKKGAAKKKGSGKGQGKKKASSVFEDSDDADLAKKTGDNKAKVQKTGSSVFDYDDPPDVLKLTGFKKHARRRQSMAKMAKRSNCGVVKGARSESTESEGESSKKQTKRKPRRKKEEDEKEKKKQKNIHQYFSPSAVKPDPDAISSRNKKGSDEDSDEDLSDDYVPDLDELLKMPEPDAKTKDELLDELDKQIADRQKAHEKEMDKLDRDIEAEKRKRIEKKARMKENAKRRNLLETQLTEKKLREMFKQNLDYLQNIWDGKVESSRHRAFHQSIRTRHALYYMMITDPFTDEQLDWTLDEIGKVWMKSKEEHRKNNEYVWKVILAECFIKFYMDFFEVTKEEAVQMISETPLHKKDQLKDMKGSDESEGSESEEEV